MTLGRARLGALLGLAASAGIFAIGLADCAEPTQIEVDVRSDACGVLRNAGIAISAPDKIDTTKIASFTPDRPDNAGCEASPRDRVGTLIIYPSGAKDAEVGIRVVGGISRTAEECDRTGDYAGCVVARRIEKFVEGSTKRVIVILSRACEGKDCGVGKECNPAGSCVVNNSDGGVDDAGQPDTSTLPDSSTDAPTDAPPDVIVDAGVDACVNCTGAGATCNAGACTINCGGAAGTCSNKAVCGAGLDCNVQCNVVNACENVSCAAGAKSCTFDCTGGNPSCDNVTCVAPSCLVKCSNAGRCSGSLTIGGGDAGITCSGNMSCDSVTTATCTGGAVCNLACDPNSCPSTKKCDASTCTGDW